MIDSFEQLHEGKKLYFASDFHLGAPDSESSSIREKRIISWLDKITDDAQGIFLVGDIFDFWFEYKQTIPKGHSRFFGKLAEITDSGIPIYIFTGNHDMWMFDYFPNEFGIPILRSPVTLDVRGMKILVGHGDGLGPGDHAYKFYKKVFNNSICQKLFEWLHPNIGIAIAKYWSHKSRVNGDEHERNVEAEWLVQYCRDTESKRHYDYYIFGHRHIACEIEINSNSKYINLGEWIDDPHYAVLDHEKLELLKYS